MKQEVRGGIPWWLGLIVIVALFVLPNLLHNVLAAIWLRFPGLDKPTHFVAFVFIFLVVYLSLLRLPRPRTERAKAGLAAGITVAVSLADEAQQALLRIGRTAEYGDLVADLAGMLVGAVCVNGRRLGAKWTTALIVILMLPVALVTANTYEDLKHYNRAMVYERERDYQRARAEYQLALESGFESAQLYNAIAWLDIEFLGADPALVEPYAARAFALDPANPDILDTYGWVLAQAGKIREGLPLLERAQRLKPDIYCIDLHLGATYLALGMHEQAAPWLRRQVERTGNDRFGQAAARLLAQIEP